MVREGDGQGVLPRLRQSENWHVTNMSLVRALCTPGLHFQEREGRVLKETPIVCGPQRKYYQIGGRRRSMRAKPGGKVAGLLGEVLEH